MTRILIAALAFSAWSGIATAQQAPQAPPDPASMSRQQLRDEVTTLRRIVQSGAVRPQRPPGCTSAESRQFDFWLGEWDVSPSVATSGIIVAESSITSHAQGCVIMENWRPLRGAHGLSINSYDTTDSAWHQTYVDATGGRTEYKGVLHDGVLAMDNLTAAQGSAPVQSRMSFQRIDDNTVRQWGEQFDPATNAWTSQFDLTYRRRAGTH